VRMFDARSKSGRRVRQSLAYARRVCTRCGMQWFCPSENGHGMAIAPPLARPGLGLEFIMPGVRLTDALGNNPRPELWLPWVFTTSRVRLRG
jgi:hypothetical protein